MTSASYPCSRCGNRVELFGLDVGALRRKAECLGASGGACRGCHAEDQRRKAEAALSQASDALSGLVVVPLDGSERQVAWAETIRAAKLMSFRAKSSAARGKGATEALGSLCQVSDARWWIERRTTSPAKLIGEVEALRINPVA